jgi:hypothetical protein
MSFLSSLESELRHRRVPGRELRKIVLELEDHLACEPASVERLGDPRELAAEFADQLASDGVRSGARNAVLALTLAAIALASSQLALDRAGGYPGFDHGLSLALAIPALLCMLIAPQVALVAGLLGLQRALRRRRPSALPAPEVALIGRRSLVALAAGIATSAGLLLYVLDFSLLLPTWWLLLVGGLAALALVALMVVARGLRSCVAITVSPGGAPTDVFDELALLRPLASRPWLLGAGGSVLVGALATLLAWHAESSLLEGLERGAFEGLAAAIGFAALGRLVGMRR